MRPARAPSPTLAAQALRLRSLSLPGAVVEIVKAGALLRYQFTAQPAVGCRDYRCRIELDRQGLAPSAYVISPDLQVLAHGRSLPHIYRYAGGCTKLCLYMPGLGEWHPGAWLTETMVPWTLEWLRYFELWLADGSWSGGGQHPSPQPRRRWGVRGTHQ